MTKEINEQFVIFLSLFLKSLLLTHHRRCIMVELRRIVFRFLPSFRLLPLLVGDKAAAAKEGD